MGTESHNPDGRKLPDFCRLDTSALTNVPLVAVAQPAWKALMQSGGAGIDLPLDVTQELIKSDPSFNGFLCSAYLRPYPPMRKGPASTGSIWIEIREPQRVACRALILGVGNSNLGKTNTVLTVAEERSLILRDRGEIYYVQSLWDPRKNCWSKPRAIIDTVKSGERRGRVILRDDPNFGVRVFEYALCPGDSHPRSRNNDRPRPEEQAWYDSLVVLKLFQDPSQIQLLLGHQF